MKLNKNIIRQAFIQKFWNGKIIELHSGDLDEIVDLILKLSNNNNQPTHLVMMDNYPLEFTDNTSLKYWKDEKKLTEDEIDNLEFIKIKLGEINI